MNKLKQCWRRFLTAVGRRLLRLGRVRLPNWAILLGYYFNEHTIIERIEEKDDPLNEQIIGKLIIHYARPDNTWYRTDPRLPPGRVDEVERALEELNK